MPTGKNPAAQSNPEGVLIIGALRAQEERQFSRSERASVVFESRAYSAD
jgi:hypothetical protein